MARAAAEALGACDDPEASDEYVALAPAPQTSPAAAVFSWRSFWAFAGPGWLVSAAYLDPRALEFDLQSGAYARYELLYVALLRVLAGGSVQVLVAQLGVRSERGLAQFCRHEYPRGVALTLWATAMLAIAAFCARQVIGAAVALQTLVESPLTLGCALAGVSVLALLAIVSDNAGVDVLPPASQPASVGFQGGKLMALLFMALLVTMTVCFVSVFSLSAPSADGLARALFHPRLRMENVMPTLSMLSAIVIPHNLFLHTALVAKRAKYRPGLSKRALSRYATLEVVLALLVGFLVNAAVLSAFAGSIFSSQCAQLSTNQISAIYGTGTRTACVPVAAARASGNRIYDARTGNTCVFMRTQVFEGDGVEALINQEAAACTLCYVDSHDVFSPDTATPSISAGYCQEVGLTDAADAVGGALGGAAGRLWAVGMLASGVASAMAGAYTAQLITEAFLLSSRVKGRTWKARAGLTRSIALLPAVAIAIVIVHKSHDLRDPGNGTHETSERWLVLLDVVQSAQLPLVLAPLISFLIRTRGDGGAVFSVVVWMLIASGALLCALNYGVAYNFLKNALPDHLPKAEWIVTILIALGYASLLFYLAVVCPSVEVARKWIPLRHNADPLAEVIEEYEDLEDAVPSDKEPLLTPEL
jgi:NRAMP (natural resistance-associated macrophage protein)-like metal ion transporter